MMVQLLRAGVPVASLALLSWARRTFKPKNMRKEEAVMPDLMDQFIDFVFCVTALATIMIGLSFFVGRLGIDRESGLRHLIHVSGLSRLAYWGAMVCIEGLLQGLFEAFLIIIIGGIALEIRMVQETSLFLTMFSMSAVVVSSVLVGCIIHMLFRSQRTSNIVATVFAIFLAFAATVYSGTRDIVPSTRLVVWIMACPVISGFQSLWVLAVACKEGGTNLGHCLTMQDLNDGPFFSPFEMLFGSSRASEVTLGGGYFSLVMVNITQNAVLWPLVLLADMLYYRPLGRRNDGDSEEASDDFEADDDTRISTRSVLEIRHLVHWYSWLSGLPGLPLQLESTLQQCQNVNTWNKVLDGVSFCIEPGAMLGLLGPNGAGKTTTIRCITGEEVPRQGQVLLCPVHGTPRNTPSARDFGTPMSSELFRVQAHKEHSDSGLLGRSPAARTSGKLGYYLGLCPQESSLCGDLSVEEHLLFFARIRDCAEPYRVAEHYLNAIHLEHKRSCVPDELSGGMRRRLAVGCSMVGDPSLALLDEPTTGLDPVARREIWTAIMDARDSGTACLLTTHMLEEAEELCTHIVILSQGQVAAEGSVQQLKEMWSTGYMLHVDAKAGDEPRVRAYVAALLPEHYKIPVKTSLHGQMIFNVSRDAEFVGHLFLQLARGASSNGIRHWGISQASLEDAYMKIIGA
jgi:ABC-type multidrug transport system ATPase subunit